MSRGPDGGIAKQVFERVPGVWWPAADEHGCRAAARAWADVASCVHRVAAAGSAAAGAVVAGNAGAEFDKFAGHWQRFDDGGGGGFLPTAAVAAETMSHALYQYADSVTKVKHRVEEELLIAAGTILVAVGTLWIPVVGEVGAATAAATSAALVAATAALESAFITAVAEIAGTMVAGAALGALTAVVADVVVAQPIKMAFGDQAAWHWDAGEMLTAAKGGAIGGSIAGGLSGATQLAGVMSEGGGLAAGAPRLAAALGRMPAALESPIGQVLAGTGVNAATGYALNGQVTGLDLITGAAGAMAGHVAGSGAGRGPLLDAIAEVDPTSPLAEAAGGGFRSRLGALNEMDAVIKNQGRLPDLPEGWSGEAVLSPVGRSPMGGDFAVSALSNEGRTLEVALLDAKGHGAEAAPTSIALAGPMQSMITESPGEPFLDAASAHVADHLGFGEPVPGVHLSLDLQTGDYVLRDAGNGAPFHVHSDGTWEPLQGRGVMLGTREMVPPELRGTPHTGTVAPGEALVLYTDGVVEMPGNQIPAGMELLRAEAAPLIEAGHPLVAQRILDALPGYGDDRSLIVLRRDPQSDVFAGPGQPFDPAIHGAQPPEVVRGLDPTARDAFTGSSLAPSVYDQTPLDPGLRSTYDELWQRTAATGQEHALVQLGSGDVVITRGGPDGFTSWDLPDGQHITKLLAHTHPEQTGLLGPSAEDRLALGTHDQPFSVLIEGGRASQFFGHDGDPLPTPIPREAQPGERYLVGGTGFDPRGHPALGDQWSDLKPEQGGVWETGTNRLGNMGVQDWVNRFTDPAAYPPGDTGDVIVDIFDNGPFIRSGHTRFVAAMLSGHPVPVTIGQRLEAYSMVRSGEGWWTNFTTHHTNADVMDPSRWSVPVRTEDGSAAPDWVANPTLGVRHEAGPPDRG